MANYTQHYQLHQWEPEDDFLRTDFNQDFQKIDTAIKGVETGLQANLDDEADRLDGEVDRLDGAIATAQQTVQNNLNTQVTRLDGAIATAQQTVQNNLNTQVTRLDGAISTAQQTVQNNLNTQVNRLDTTLTALQQTLNKKLEIVTGSFVGTAIDTSITEQHISLGFQPCFVVFGTASFWYGGQGGADSNCVVIYPGVPCDGISGGSRKGGAKIEATGFLVYGVSNYINTTYQYIAFRTV